MCDVLVVMEDVVGGHADDPGADWVNGRDQAGGDQAGKASARVIH
ncbi:hypothetical protein [Streptomyces atratus]